MEASEHLHFQSSAHSHPTTSSFHYASSGIALEFHCSRCMAHYTFTVTIISDSALELGAMTGFILLTTFQRKHPGRRANNQPSFVTNKETCRGKAIAICTCTRRCIKLTISHSIQHPGAGFYQLQGSATLVFMHGATTLYLSRRDSSACLYGIAMDIMAVSDGFLYIDPWQAMTMHAEKSAWC